jgi:L-lactate dehydrogenase complex protein LldG
MSDAAATIVGRIREALRVPAPPPHMRSHAVENVAAAGPAALPILPADVARPWLPDGGDTPEHRVTLLTENLGRLRAYVRRVPDLAAAAGLVGTLVAERGWQRVAWHGHATVDPLVTPLGVETYRVDGGPFDAATLESCAAGITACDAAVAQTGSILVSSGTCGGRAISILPHVHVVVVPVGLVVGTLRDAFDLVRKGHGGRLPSMLSFITGPSRTGDIERILVLGAHGPKELIVVLVG